MRKKGLYCLLTMMLLLVGLVACRRSGVSGTLSGGDTLRFKYAEHISIVRHADYVEVALSNPWKPGATLHRYILVDRKDSSRLTNLPNGTVVYTPVCRSVVFTSPHCNLLKLLGAGGAVSGVCDLAYINISSVQQAARSGKIVDCGNSMSPSVERIVSVQPQALFVSPYEGASYGQIDHIGVPVIECADYMETSALGRAEWMKFYGMLVGRSHEADSLFSVVERNYFKTRQLAARSKRRPKVITERVVSGVWYCPGGRSSMGQLIADAGGDYVFAGDSHSGSLTLSPEKVIEKAAEADCWLFVGSGSRLMTRAQLLDEYPGYKVIRAFKDGSVYECLPSMTNLYFEETSFRPDMLLTDFVKIFHPELMKVGTTRYYKKIM